MIFFKKNLFPLLLLALFLTAQGAPEGNSQGCGQSNLSLLNIMKSGYFLEDESRRNSYLENLRQKQKPSAPAPALALQTVSSSLADTSINQQTLTGTARMSATKLMRVFKANKPVNIREADTRALVIPDSGALQLLRQTCETATLAATEELVVENSLKALSFQLEENQLLQIDDEVQRIFETRSQPVRALAIRLVFQLPENKLRYSLTLLRNILLLAEDGCDKGTVLSSYSKFLTACVESRAKKNTVLFLEDVLRYSHVRDSEAGRTVQIMTKLAESKADSYEDYSMYLRSTVPSDMKLPLLLEVLRILPTFQSYVWETFSTSLPPLLKREEDSDAEHVQILWFFHDLMPPPELLMRARIYVFFDEFMHTLGGVESVSARMVGLKSRILENLDVYYSPQFKAQVEEFKANKGYGDDVGKTLEIVHELFGRNTSSASADGTGASGIRHSSNLLALHS